MPYFGLLGKRLDQILSKIFFQYSRSCLKNWIIMNHVYVNGKIENKPDKKLLGGELVTIYPIVKKISFNLPEKILLNVIYEDNDILIINKPSGLVVHPGAGNQNGTILNALLYRYTSISNIPRCGIVHRLDKNTTGLMVIAKNLFAYNQLVKLLKKRKIIREYQGIVKGNMISGGVVNYPIMRHPLKRICMITHPLGKRSITYYKIINRFKFHTHVLFKLETGRTHQIRVHMLHIRYPLLGDPLYGGIDYYSKDFKKEKKIYFFRQALHASYIELIHPCTKKSMNWTAPLPEDMEDLILYLNK